MGLKNEIKEWWKDSSYETPIPKTIRRKLNWYCGLILLWMFTGGLIVHFGQPGIGGFAMGASLYAFFNMEKNGYAGISSKELFESKRPGSKKWCQKSRDRKAWEIFWVFLWVWVIAMLFIVF